MKSKASRLYDAFRNMHRRCYDPEYHSYHRYGGRGIQVCSQWHNFQNFKQDLLDKWDTGISLERLDNDKDYELSNVLCIEKELNTKPRKIDYEELMYLRDQGVPYKELAERYGVSLSAVNAAAYKVRNGKTTF